MVDASPSSSGKKKGFLLSHNYQWVRWSWRWACLPLHRPIYKMKWEEVEREGSWFMQIIPSIFNVSFFSAASRRGTFYNPRQCEALVPPLNRTMPLIDPLIRGYPWVAPRNRSHGGKRLAAPQTLSFRFVSQVTEGSLCFCLTVK